MTDNTAQTVAPASTILDRHNVWSYTAHGGFLQPLDPKPEHVRINDIAHGLSLNCRYNAQCAFHYSVAQHSLLVCDILQQQYPGDPMLHLIGLLHDATEAYLPDVITHIKAQLSGWEVIEQSVYHAICEAFGLTDEIPQEVKFIDQRIRIDELLALFPNHFTNTNLTASPYSYRFGVVIE